MNACGIGEVAVLKPSRKHHFYAEKEKYMKITQSLHVTHEFPPVYDKDCEILILGSIPSPKSREAAFYYGHPQNRFWKVLAAVYEEKVPECIEEKKQMVLSHHIALWDALEACDICGASDSSIKNPEPTDIPKLLKETRIRHIYTTGAAAYKFYQKLNYPRTGIRAVKLPSTSPANCAFSLERLVQAYQVIRSTSSGNTGKKHGEWQNGRNI